jgi:DNA-binding transcriptional LysR family regulator
MQWEERIGRRIKFRDLHIALAVAQSGSMLKAAEVLAISQPVVSKVISDLEQALGVRLFDRSRKGVQPTASGRALLVRGRAAFDELKQGVKEIEFLNDPTAGELRIGCSPVLAEEIVLAAVDRLSRKYPRVVFHVVSTGTLELHQLLRERQVDFGFARMLKLPPQEEINQESLFAESLVVVAAAENPWSRRRKIRLADLVNEPWTWPAPGTAMDSFVVEAFRAIGIEPPRAAVYADAVTTRIRLAAMGRFLAVLPASIFLFHAKHASLKMLPVELPTMRRTIGIITLKNRALNPLAGVFIECARDVAASKAGKSNG